MPISRLAAHTQAVGGFTPLTASIFGGGAENRRVPAHRYGHMESGGTAFASLQAVLMEIIMRAILLVMLAAALALAMHPARAAVISTDETLWQTEREQLQSLLDRPELARELEKHGVAPHEAQARVAAMNDAEVRQLTQRINALPAGGQSVLLIVIIILLLIVIF
jgi:hypothetical protein